MENIEKTTNEEVLFEGNFIHDFMGDGVADGGGVYTLGNSSGDGYNKIHSNYIKTVLDNAPTVDAVPVVRCCQCSKRYDADECPMCHLVEGEYNEYTADDGFCDRGEMRAYRAKMDLEVSE